MDESISSARGQDDSSTSSKFKQINDSLFLLHEPEGTPKVDIIFFHGLQEGLLEETENHEAYWKSWMTLCKSDFKPGDSQAKEAADKSVCWPSAWLGEQLKGARIYSVAYDASVKETEEQGRLDMFNIAENQITEILDLNPNHPCKVGHDWPVILVGHSIGGLVIKNLLLAAQFKAGMLRRTEGGESENTKRIETFLSHVKGVFFYSTPHRGTNLADFIDKAIEAKYKTKGKAQRNKPAPIMSYFSVLSKESARLNDFFRSWRRPYLETPIQTSAVAESRPTMKWGFNKLVTVEGSGRDDMDLYYTAGADHFTVIRPQSTKNNIYSNLLKFIAEYGKVEILKEISTAQVNLT